MRLLSAIYQTKLSICIAILLASSLTATACDIDASEFVGWTIIYSGTVTGYYDEDGQAKDEFEGCEHGRILIVDYNSVITCAEYNYSYAYQPDIIILSNGSRLKACIDDDMYDVAK